MAGYTVDNQLKGAAEETTAAATVTGGGNSDSDGNGDGDSKDKDGDADVKGFFGWIPIIIS